MLTNEERDIAESLARGHSLRSVIDGIERELDGKIRKYSEYHPDTTMRYIEGIRRALQKARELKDDRRVYDSFVKESANNGIVIKNVEKAFSGK